MSTIVRVPLEIWDIIIDQLSAYRSALLACSLTCRMWVARTRLHLFCSVEIRDGSRCDSLARIIEMSPQVSTTLHRGISHYIRRVAIRPSIDSYLSPSGEYFCEIAAWLVHSLSTILTKLDAMTGLSLGDVDWTSQLIVQNLYPAILKIGGRLETLRLCGGQFTSPRQLNNFISTFPRLSSLVLEAVLFQALDVHTAANADSAELMANDGMGGIHLNSPLSHDMRHQQRRDSSATPCVDGSPAEPRLRRLICSSWLPMSFIGIRMLIEQSGPSLQTVRLKPTFTRNLVRRHCLESSLDRLDLSCSTGIDCLSITVVDSALKRQTSPCHSWIASLLATIHAPSLRKVEVCFGRYKDGVGVDWIDLPRLVEALELLRQKSRNATALLRFLADPDEPSGWCDDLIRLTMVTLAGWSVTNQRSYRKEHDLSLLFMQAGATDRVYYLSRCTPSVTDDLMSFTTVIS